MCERIEDVIGALRAAVSALRPREMSGLDAERVVEVFAEGERLCQAGRTLASERVLRTGTWRRLGYRTPATWMASRTQTTLSHAITAVQTAHRLHELPATREAFATGKLSESQTAEIAAAAEADPGAESALLTFAASQTVAELREQCRGVRAAAESDENAAERIRRGRFLRHWSDPDGAIRMDARLAPDDGAQVVAVIRARADQLMREARRSGQRESVDAHAADALVGLACGTPGPKAVVHVHVDADALARGRTDAGETCSIPGVGPIPVAAARRLAAEGVVKALATDGADVQAVAHFGRGIPARVRTALEARDQTCVVPGCDVRSGLEIDHVIPLARGGPTSLDNLARLCRYHHAQKTHHGWRLGGPPGARAWTHPGRERLDARLAREPNRERAP
ncbi:MAG: DUF222 domain-containing protein [Actinomycetota bacterium]